MKINSALIRSERLKRAWSQEHLAEVTGLGLRTVQRIESGSNASLETVKAFAATLQMPLEALLVDDPTQSVAVSRPRFRLFRPWPVFAAGCAVTAIVLGGLFNMNMQGALAEKVAMDFDVTLNAEKLSPGRVTSEDGSPIALEIREQLRIKLIPTIRENGFVRLDAEIFVLDDGEPSLLARPSVQAKSGTPAMFRVGDNAAVFGNDGSMQLELLVTPTIE